MTGAGLQLKHMIFTANLGLNFSRLRLSSQALFISGYHGPEPHHLVCQEKMQEILRGG